MPSLRLCLSKLTRFSLLMWTSIILSAYLSACLGINSLAQTPFGSNSFNQCAYNGTSCGISSNGLKLLYDANSSTSYPGTGQVIYDLSGNGANGTFGIDSNVASDDPTFNSTGVKSFGFVNASEIINTSIFTNFSSDFTLETWFKRSTNNDAVSACERLINMNSNIANADRASLGLCGTNIAARGRTTDNTGPWIKNTRFTANTEWQMATLTYNSTSQSMKVYVNAVVHSSSTQGILPGTNNPILIGASASGSNAQNFVGQIAVTRIYNRDLTSSEVTTHFDAEKSRFGFGSPNLAITVPTTINFGNFVTSMNEQTVQIELNNLTIVDRRSNFAPFAVTLGISDFVNGSNTIKKDKISVNFPAPTLAMGSNLYNSSGTSGSLVSSQTVLNNSSANGGINLIYKPIITLKIPAYAKNGNYSATINFNVS